MAARIGIVTLGCDKNTVDSEYYAGVLGAAGFEAVEAGMEPDPGMELDAVVINTCGFIADAKEQSVGTIVAWLERKREVAEEGGRLGVFVTGCLAQRYRDDLLRELPDVDGLMGVGDVEQIAAMMRGGGGAAAGPADFVRDQPSVRIDHAVPRRALGPATPHAFLKIADGCDHHCAFCAIPSFKGRYASVPKAVLLGEAQGLLARGAQELILVAQDTGAYGRDLYGANYGICDLLSDLAAIPGRFWLRVLYFYPGGVTERFLDCMRSVEKIVPYVDMPLQHLHPDVLRHMKRPHLEVRTFDLVARMREVVPGLAIRTTLLTGFPGETDEHFQFMLRGAEVLRFERLGGFAFSPEEGTPAARMRKRVPPGVARRRLGRLMKRQAMISQEINTARIGSEIEVLVESSLGDGRFAARSQWDAPEVDGQVYVACGGGLVPGDLARVRVVGADTYDLHAEAIEPCR